MNLLNTSLSIATTKFDAVKKFYINGFNMKVELDLPIMTVLSSTGLHLVITKSATDNNQAYELTYGFNSLAELNTQIAILQANGGKIVLRLTEEELASDDQSPAAIISDPLNNEILLHLIEE